MRLCATRLGAISRASRAGAAPIWTPAALFAAGEAGAWFDPSDLTTIFQDAAGTIPGAVDMPVGLVRDKSGRGNHATQAGTARPTLKQDSSGRYYLAFDGVDDSLATAAINFTGTDKMTVLLGLRKLSDAATGIVVELSATTGGNNGTFHLAAPNTGSNYTWRSKGTLPGDAAATGAAYAAPVTSVLACSGSIAGDISILRVNGTQAASSAADQGTGNYGNYPLFIGRRNSASLPFNGRVYGLIVRGAASAPALFAAGEAWVNDRTGAY